MTEDPPTPQDDETPDAAGDVAEPEQSADPSESPAEQPATEGDTPAEPEAQADAEPEVQADAPADDTTSADEPGGSTDEGTNAPDEPAQAPDVVGADGGAEAGAQAAGVDEGPDAETAESRDRPSPSDKKRTGREESGGDPDVVPGAHLEPDLVLESERAAETPDEFGAYAQTYDAGTNPEDDSADGRPAEPGASGEGAEAAPARKPLDLAADARY